MEKRYYIAYGSNLNTQQMRARCPGAKIIGTGVIEDCELLFRGSKTGAYLTIEGRKDSSVPVVVWSTTAEDEAALDRYEGCPTFYYKAEMTITVTGVRSGKPRKRTCYIYIMHEERKIGLPSDEYVRTCLRGYYTFGFDTEPLLTALQRSWKEHCENEYNAAKNLS